MTIKNKNELEILREGGRKLADILEKVAQAALPGKTTKDLDTFAEQLILESGGRPSFKGYRVEGTKVPYPATLCVSIGSEVVHGIPSLRRVLKEGDFLGLDIGMEYKGLYTDTAMTLIVGDEDLDSLNGMERNLGRAQRLLQATKKALDIGIAAVHAGARVGDISFAIQKFLEGEGFGVVRELAGHGVGRAVHEDPEIPNWGRPGVGPVLLDGEVIALEPMATTGRYEVKLFPDGWTWATKDGSLAAHFEHTVVVTKKGAEVLTKAEK